VLWGFAGEVSPTVNNCTSLSKKRSCTKVQRIVKFFDEEQPAIQEKNFAIYNVRAFSPLKVLNLNKVISERVLLCDEGKF
jgi:hypothetical protein